ncbi:hypothetical protein D9758_010427 [Tetrapyrgos nigripes]|uniref:Protein kinase domain-containing protein n=1 Tax=Tetrapyrgos nigripes TaxID=182062 RepID=A0A8H5CNC2_9AGAR|nr:hypothetical protein D9758_010427 [Tetrapyrgos nigripes]
MEVDLGMFIERCTMNKWFALKRMRTFQRNSGMANARRRFCREALVWQQLNSAFIVPFFGIDNESFPGFMCLVSPWMRNGTILKHLEEHGKADVDERLHEIAQGLAYLHSQNIIHGDLRGSNILINDQWQACLTDFGLTVFDDTTLVPLTSRHEGSVRWMAPELHMPESFGLDRFRLTVKTDVYAFGCVCLELYTGNAPFSELAHDTAVMLRVLKGERPSRPTGAFKMSDGLWEIVGRCWSHNHEERSEADKLVENIGCIINSARGHNEVDHDCPDTQALSTPSSAEITDVSSEAHLPSEFEPVKLLEKPSLESLSVYRLSSFPFVVDDPFAASQDWLQTPDSPLLPSLILTEAQDSVQERQPDVLEAASSSHSPSVSASREWGSNEPALAVQELEDIVNSMTPPISSPLAEDCCLDKCQRTIPPDALDVQQKDGHDVTAGEELAAAWSDCMQLYKEAVGNRDRTPSEILDSQDENGAPESHLIRTLQAVIDLNGLLLELEDRHVPSQSNETRTGYIRLLQPPLHSTPDCPSLLGLKDQSSCATAPLEHTAICQEFEHELDVAFDRDFSLSDLEKKPDRQVVGPQTMDEDVKESSHTYTVLCEFLAIFVISVAIYALFSYFCFGGLVLQPVLMNMY